MWIRTFDKKYLTLYLILLTERFWKKMEITIFLNGFKINMFFTFKHEYLKTLTIREFTICFGNTLSYPLMKLHGLNLVHCDFNALNHDLVF